MITINLSSEQLKVAEIAVATFIGQLAIDRRESTYSEITNNRWKTILEVQKILGAARYK